MVCNYIQSVWEVGNFTGVFSEKTAYFCDLFSSTWNFDRCGRSERTCFLWNYSLKCPIPHNYKLFFGGPEVGRGKTCHHRPVIYITLWILGKFPLIRYHSFVLIELDVTLWIIYIYICIGLNKTTTNKKQKEFWVHWFALDAPQDTARSFGLRNKRWNPGDEEFQRRNPTWSLGARTQGPQDKELGTSVDLSDGKLRRVGVGIEMILPYLTSKHSSA